MGKSPGIFKLCCTLIGKILDEKLHRLRVVFQRTRVLYLGHAIRSEGDSGEGSNSAPPIAALAIPEKVELTGVVKGSERSEKYSKEGYG